MCGVPMIAPSYLDPINACQGRVVVGLSGGMDSVVLLHQMTLLDNIELTAIHINHQLQSEANDWARFCRQLCAVWGVPLICESVVVETAGNLEAMARQARYNAFKTHLKENDLLLLAHHQNDQIETIFLSLLRGHSPLGLKGMPLTRSVGNATLLRPLLAVSRDAIAEYAIKNGLNWVEDKSNLDANYDRNFLRWHIIPQLKQRWPDMSKNILSAWERTEDKLMALETEAQTLLAHCLRSPRLLALARFAELNGTQQVAVLRRWLLANMRASPTQKSLAEGRDAFLHASQGTSPLLAWRNIHIRRYQDTLFLFPRLYPEPDDILRFTRPRTNIRNGFISARLAKGPGIRTDQMHNIEIRFRGSSVYPGLKKLFQTHRLPGFFRDNVPLLFLADRLIAIAAMPEYGLGMIFKDAVAADQNDLLVCIEWHLGHIIAV